MSAAMTKDKICLELSDAPELAEKISRMEAGETLRGTFTATLDEAKDGQAILSITEIKLAAKAKPDKTKSVAVKMFSDDDAKEGESTGGAE